MSLAPYFWPNPNTPNGLPYVRKDGERNPEIKSISDHRYIDNMADAVKNLSLAYYFTGNEAYAQRAATVLRHWFLDSATKMNPNLNYAQAIKGKNDGRGIGLIESREFVLVIDAIGLLQHSKHWTSKEQTGVEDWFKAYLEWFSTSKNGIEEMNAKNNQNAALTQPLTKREIDVLRSLATGKPITAIGKTLHISHNTMKTHLRNIYRKLSASGREEAVSKAQTLFII
jgi:DNA-binding CsgD family transcriptional regulator